MSQFFGMLFLQILYLKLLFIPNVKTHHSTDKLLKAFYLTFFIE